MTVDKTAECCKVGVVAERPVKAGQGKLRRSSRVEPSSGPVRSGPVGWVEAVAVGSGLVWWVKVRCGWS